jgi:hypothetical protein
MTAGMVKTPVPTMLPITRPVADVRPRLWALASLRGESGGPSEAGGGGATPSDPGASVTIAMSTPNYIEVRAHRS